MSSFFFTGEIETAWTILTQGFEFGLVHFFCLFPTQLIV